MRFKNRDKETSATVVTVCVILSLGAIFLQIWILIAETHFVLGGGGAEFRWAGLGLSALALACCALTAWTTTLPPFRE